MLVQALISCVSFMNPNPSASNRAPSANVWNKRLFQWMYLNTFCSVKQKVNFRVLQVKGIANIDIRQRRSTWRIFSASDGQSFNVDMERTREVFEHICLIKAKEDLSVEGEKDMLDFLYTTQYQMSGIVSISLGRISDQKIHYTHAVYMRFQRKEHLLKFYKNPFYLRVLKEHVMPYCHELINVDYESQVENDILPIFRKGEEFNYGVEYILLIAFVDDAYTGLVEDAMTSLERLTKEFPSLIVQSTQGLNFNIYNREYTHGVVIRFRSIEAFEIFEGSTEYKDMWRSKFHPITRKTLSIYFSVDPVGTEIM